MSNQSKVSLDSLLEGWNPEGGRAEAISNCIKESFEFILSEGDTPYTVDIHPKLEEEVLAVLGTLKEDESPSVAEAASRVQTRRLRDGIEIPAEALEDENIKNNLVGAFVIVLGQNRIKLQFLNRWQEANGIMDFLKTIGYPFSPTVEQMEQLFFMDSMFNAIQKKAQEMAQHQSILEEISGNSSPQIFKP